MAFVRILTPTGRKMTNSARVSTRLQRTRSGLLVAVSILVLVVTAACLVADNVALGPVQVVTITEERWDQLVPNGKEVDAILGDLVLRNDYLTAVIAQPIASRNANMTVSGVGGGLIDLTVTSAQRTGESDQLSALWPGQRAVAYRQWRMRSAEGVEADITQNSDYRGGEAVVAVLATGTADKPRVETLYRLTATARSLEIVTRWTNEGTAPLKVALADDLRIDGSNETIVRSANGTHDLFFVEDRFWQQAYGFVAEGRKIMTNTDARNVLSYVDDSAERTVTLQPGETRVLRRWIVPGTTLSHVRATWAGQQDANSAAVAVEFDVRNQRKLAIPFANLELTRGNDSLAPWGACTLDEHGRAAVPLLAGDYHAKISVNGTVVQADQPFQVAAGVRATVSLSVGEFTPGWVVARITDEVGRPIPCKVDFSPREGPPPSFGPDTAEFGVKNLRYTPDGQFRQQLAPGNYNVIISHGPEYDAIFRELEIVSGGTALLTDTLRRTVDTSGWISSDFHSHSSPSGDNTSSQRGRVLNLVCEHLEFAPCTEHNRITTYQTHIDFLRIQPFLQSCPGMELTGSPLPLNHQNAFPLRHHHPHHQDGGGPQSAENQEVQIERLALWDDRSDKLVQQNHPDFGWLFYDKDGDGVPDEGHARGFGFMDVIEMHPVDSAMRLVLADSYKSIHPHDRLLNWLQIMNDGHRIPGVVNTDAHYNFHGSGWLRNWIASPTDDPAAIKTLDVVHAAERGNVIVSNGPFLTVTAAHPDHPTKIAIAGEDLLATDGRVQINVRVQCANWLDVDHVCLLVNGRIQPELHFTREKHPQKFRNGVVKFDETWEVKLEKDAHLIVIATGDKSRKLAPVFGGDGGKHCPSALNNPIWVDVGPPGFVFCKDTLDHPLPTKQQIPGTK